ncbi:HpcH/HpaI aldolase/citrate lyase family protein [Jezberella montanilacus]|uniref:HpcH/HpaI aldolase/citrate lyase family protein n=1 Tax=Jezberella montanilacus TaxID=323426 RepID=A0A2T0XIC2_9BURK|nr:aldolase/citrate lyase family protein [Jezberella montanilacus]PRY98662.1 HpcH/HpaI aldolase/citrate lyase family protein [Jezberella montanilacus]
MNSTERKMLSILKDMAENSEAVAVKAEFEAEGTRTEELLRLLEIARRADVKIGLKIGGCEAIRDLIEAKQFGVEYIIAPMVETPYALQKYIEAKNKVFTPDERGDIGFLVNIETDSGFQHSAEMAELAASENGIQGLVFGRVDYVGSLAMPRDSVNSPEVLAACRKVALDCKAHGLDFVVGGGISIDAVDVLKSIKDAHLSRFETRKIIFSGSALDKPALKQGLLNAVHFELLWLLNKREYYSIITNEDDKRIEMLDKRWKLLSQ